MCEKKPVFEVNKTYDMNDGRKGTVVAELNGNQLLVIYRNNDYDDTYGLHLSNGRFDSGANPSPNDLIPPMRTVYFNVNSSGKAYWYDLEIDAKNASMSSRIATAIPVEIPA